MNTSPGTAADRYGLSDHAEVHAGLDNRIAEFADALSRMEKRVTALEGDSPPVDPEPHDAVESQAHFAALSVAVKKAAENNLPIHVKGRATWRDGQRLVVPAGCTGIFSTVRAEIADRATDRGLRHGNQFKRPMILWLGSKATFYGFDTVGSRRVQPNSRAFFWYAVDRCELHTHDMNHRDHPGGVWQLRGQDVPALCENSTFEDIYNIEARTGKTQMGYPFGVYGRGRETFRKQIGEVPLSVIRNCTLRNARHTLALNHGAFGGMYNNTIVNTISTNSGHIDAHGVKGWDAPARYLACVGNDITCEWYVAYLRGGTCHLTGNKFNGDKDNDIAVTTEGDRNRDHWPVVHAWDNSPHSRFHIRQGGEELAENLHTDAPEGWPYYAA